MKYADTIGERLYEPPHPPDISPFMCLSVIESKYDRPVLTIIKPEEERTIETFLRIDLFIYEKSLGYLARFYQLRVSRIDRPIREVTAHEISS